MLTISIPMLINIGMIIASTSALEASVMVLACPSPMLNGDGPVGIFALVSEIHVHCVRRIYAS